MYVLTIRLCLLVATVMVSFPFFFICSATAEVSGWNWEQCLTAARKRIPPELMAAQYASDAASSMDVAAKATTRPRFIFSGGAGVVDDVREDESGASLGYLASLTGEMPLFPNRAQDGLIQLRKSEVLEAGASQVRIGADYLWRLRVAFLELLSAQEVLPLVSEIHSRRTSLLKAVEAKHRAGQENIGSLAVSRSALEIADHAVAQANRNLSLCRIRLNVLLGFEGLSVERICGTLGCEPAPSYSDKLVGLISSTPEYVMAKAAIQKAEARAASAKSRNSYQFDALSRVSPRSDSWTQQEPDWFAGIRLTIPLYEGGRSKMEFKAAKSAAHKAEAQLTAVERDLLIDFHTTLSRYQASAERLALQKNAVESAQLRADIARREYEAGLTSLVSWESAERDCAQKSINAIRIGHDAALAQARWERLLGGTSHDTIEELNHE
jgi:outer membrane protein TolC